MAENVLTKNYISLSTKLLWCFWNILVALVPIFAWFILAKNPIDLWTGTISCACALSGSVAFSTVYNREGSWDSKLAICLSVFLGGILCILLIFSFNEVECVKKIIIDWWYCSYFIFIILLIPVIYATFRKDFENFARIRDRELTKEKQKEEVRIIQNITQESTNIDIN